MGLRLGEGLNLRIGDIDRQSMRVHLRQGKGKKDRHVPLDSHTEGVLRRYAESREGRPRLFALTRTGVYLRVRRLSARASVNASRPIHRFRDTYAVRYLENGGAIDDLQVILGHANMETTLRYVRWGREQRAVDAGRRFTPWANNGNGHKSEYASVGTHILSRDKGELALLEELERITRRKLELLQAKARAS